MQREHVKAWEQASAQGWGSHGGLEEKWRVRKGTHVDWEEGMWMSQGG